MEYVFTSGGELQRIRNLLFGYYFDFSFILVVLYAAGHGMAVGHVVLELRFLRSCNTTCATARIGSPCPASHLCWNLYSSNAAVRCSCVFSVLPLGKHDYM